MKRVKVIGIIIAICSVVIFTPKIMQAGQGNSVKTYNSISELCLNANFKVSVPKQLLDEEDLEFNSTQGRLIEIKNNNLLFRASKFVDEKADVSGIYREYKMDKAYDVNNSVIKSLRVRADSDDLNNMENAVINYNTDEAQYSIEFFSTISLEDMLKIIDLSESNISEKQNEETDNTETDNKQATYSYKSQNTDGSLIFEANNINLSMVFPNTSSPIHKVEDNESVVFIIGDKSVITISKDRADDSRIETLELNNGYYLQYYRDNIFEDDTEEYRSYNTILDNMESIVKSIKEFN